MLMQLVFFTPLDEIRDTYIFREDFQVSGEGVSKVMGSTCEITNVVAKKEKEALVVSANLSLSVLIKDTSGSVSNINKILDVKYERKSDYNDSDIFCLPKLNVFSLDCAEKGNNSIDVRAEINVSASVFGKIFIDAVADITESELIARKVRIQNGSLSEQLQFRNHIGACYKISMTLDVDNVEFDQTWSNYYE